MKLPWYSVALLVMLAGVALGVTDSYLAVGWEDFDSYWVIHDSLNSLQPGESMTISFFVNESKQNNPKDVAIQVQTLQDDDLPSDVIQVSLNGVDYGSHFSASNSKLWFIQYNTAGNRFWNCGENTVVLKNIGTERRTIMKVTVGEEYREDIMPKYCSSSPTTTIPSVTTTTTQGTTTTLNTGSGDEGTNGFGLGKSTVELLLCGGFIVSLFWPRRVI